MAFSASAAVQTSSRRVLVTLTDIPGTAATIVATAQHHKFDAWSREYDVSEWTPQTGADIFSAGEFYDFPPFNWITRYQVEAFNASEVSVGTCTSNEVTLAVSEVHVMSIAALTGWDAQMVDDSFGYQARSSWHTVVGRRQPLAQVAPMLEADGSLRMRLADRDAFADFRATVDEGWPVRVRSGVANCWTSGVLLPTSVRVEQMGEGITARFGTIDYQTLLEHAIVRTATDPAEA